VQYYKVARGDDVIPIIGGSFQDAAFTEKVVEESHGFWQELIRGEVDTGKINYNQTSTRDIDSWISSCSTTRTFDIPPVSAIEPAAPKPEKYNHWYYLDEDFQLIEI
jgi:inorganic pyrophosphatase